MHGGPHPPPEQSAARRTRTGRTGAVAVLAAAAIAGAAACGAAQTTPTADTANPPRSAVVPGTTAPDRQLVELTAPGRPIPDGCEIMPGKQAGALLSRVTIPSVEGIPTLVTVSRCTRPDGAAALLVSAWVDGGDHLARLGAVANPALWRGTDPVAGAAQVALAPGGGYVAFEYVDGHGTKADVPFKVSVTGIEAVPLPSPV